jgi:hypothetical protein
MLRTDDRGEPPRRRERTVAFRLGLSAETRAAAGLDIARVFGCPAIRPGYRPCSLSASSGWHPTWSFLNDTNKVAKPERLDSEHFLVSTWLVA